MKTSMMGRARRLLATSAVFALALALILTTIAMAWSPAIVGTYVPAEIYGDMWDIAVSGNYVYVTFGSGFRVVDVSNPSSPVEVGKYNTYSGMTDDIFLSGSYVYLGNGGNGRVYIVDVSTPTTPTLRSSISLGSSGFEGVYVTGNRLYIAREGVAYPNFWIYNVTNPASPTLLGTANIPWDGAKKIAVSGNYAYITDRSLGLLVYNVSNPASPTFVSAPFTQGTPYDIQVAGNYIYLAAGDLGIYSISNPAAPVMVSDPNDSTIATNNSFEQAIYVRNNVAYLAGGDGIGFEYFNVSNPAAPVLLGALDTPGYGKSVAASAAGDYAYVGDNYNGYYNGMHVISLADHTNPSATISLSPSGWTSGSVTATVTGSDSGGSGLKQVRCSADGVTWGAWQSSGICSRVYAATGTIYWQAEDNSANVSSGSTPVSNIDGMPPTNPTLVTETHGVISGVWQSTVADPAFTWRGASDALSGVKGYYWAFSGNSAVTPTTWLSHTGAATATQSVDPFQSSVGTYYLRVVHQNIVNELI